MGGTERVHPQLIFLSRTSRGASNAIIVQRVSHADIHLKGRQKESRAAAYDTFVLE